MVNFFSSNTAVRRVRSVSAVNHPTTTTMRLPRLYTVPECETWKNRIESEIYARMQFKDKYGHLVKKGTKLEMMSRDVGRVPSEKELQQRYKEVCARLDGVREEIKIEDLIKYPPKLIDYSSFEDKVFPRLEKRPIYPVDPCIQEYLRENHGRELYLKLRNEHLEPDEKTEFTQTESQEIGWRIREYEKGKLKSEFLSKYHSQESHRPNGAFTRDGYPLVRDGTENEGIPKADLTLIS